MHGELRDGLPLSAERLNQTIEKNREEMLRLLRDSDLRERIGTAGNQLMRSLYTPERAGILAARYCWELISALGRQDRQEKNAI